MTRAEQLAQLTQAELIAKLTAMESNRPSNGLKVSTKGAVSLYGVGRFPVTLYRSQWERVIEMVQDGTIPNFIAANADSLASKPGKDA
jgi:hypothetical protein